VSDQASDHPERDAHSCTPASFAPLLDPLDPFGALLLDPLEPFGALLLDPLEPFGALLLDPLAPLDPLDPFGAPLLDPLAEPELVAPVVPVLALVDPELLPSNPPESLAL
jgi:hypothetical protein